MSEEKPGRNEEPETEEDHEAYVYSYGSLALTFFVIGLLVAGVRIPFLILSITFGALAFNYYKQAQERPKTPE